MDQETEKIKTPEYVTLHFQLAGLGSRASALILDGLILAAGNALFGFLLYLIFRSQNALFGGDPFLLLGIAIVGVLVINWGYFFVCEYFFAGKTIGKKSMGIRVIQDNGHSLTLLSSFIRNLLRIIDILPTAYFLGIVMIFFHPRHKRLGDVTAGTLVVHERKAKQEKGTTKLKREIQSRGLAKNQLPLEDWTLRSLQGKDWKLIQTYSHRFLHLPPVERKQRTQQVASILLPKISFNMEGKTEQELENLLLILYLILEDEWAYKE